MAGLKIEGSTSNNGLEVTTQGRMLVALETAAQTNAAQIGGVRTFTENDQGLVTGVIDIQSPESDIDFRLRMAMDTMLDDHTFNYTAQNTGVHSLATTSMAATFTAGQFSTNTGLVTTTTTGVTLSTYAYFPMMGTNTLSCDMELAFSAQPTTNTFVEFGIGLAGTATTAPTDGVFFRLNSAGLQGIASSNGTETSTGVFPLSAGTGVWAYTNNKRYQFIAYASAISAEFWVNDGGAFYRLGSIPLPAGQGRMTMAQSAPVFLKHRITGGAAAGVMQAFLGAYSVRIGGAALATSLLTQGNRIFGAYQGQSGGTMGSLASYANSANPAAAVATNTTAALGSGLGGQFWETDTLAVNTDGIIQSYQVPLGTVNTAGRRLVIRGIAMTSDVQTVLVGGPYVAHMSLAWGHTAVSLATAEGVTGKAPRRKALPQLKQVVTAAQAASTIVAQPGGSYCDFGDAPIYVNPGEFIQVVRKRIGTAVTAGVIAHQIDFVYGWE